MKIENDNCRYQVIKNCFISVFGGCIWNGSTSSKKLNCGGKGFAAILHTGGARKGNTGAGLGYKSVKNVFAIEFDTSYDSSLNDPNVGSAERHISVLVNRGYAEADES